MTDPEPSNRHDNEPPAQQTEPGEQAPPPSDRSDPPPADTSPFESPDMDSFFGGDDFRRNGERGER